MSRYTLYYWSAPFRGQFVRALLAHAGATWVEAGDAAVTRLMEGAIDDMPVPFMGPPVLVDAEAGLTLSQTPAILLYLGDTLHLLPKTAAGRALSIKVANDANDVIDELTLDGGRQMWTESRWAEFAPRLKRWMGLWEDLGRRHGLKPQSGFLLGGETAGVADVVTATLWSTMAERFPLIDAMLEESAPLTTGLVRRMAQTPPLAELAARARADYGDLYCGGRIEQSLREVLEAQAPADRTTGPRR
ncbi:MULTISPECIES: glutathione S-transferase [unclassified Brevundimonas]|uniref:glutathione S-transferase n=1 Tax=unclassified Brevundimonas TaxID=2622653 RepID=UPI0025C4CFD3|nr:MULTISPECIES: glutathione S-transferase [unclassified Brevundimonas]